MKNFKYIVMGAVLGVICTLAFVLLSNGARNEQDTPITIGAALGLSGDASDWAQATKNGIDLAVENLAREGVDVRVVYEDTASDARQSVSAVSKLVNVDGVKGIIITWLDVYQGAESLVRDLDDRIMISPDAGVEAMIPADNVFSLWYRTKPKAETLIDFIASGSHTRLAVVLPQDSYYRSFGGFVEDSCKRNSFDCYSVYFSPGSHEDFRTLITKIKTNGADAILFASYNQSDTASFFKEQKVLYPEVALYGEEFAKDFIANPDIKQYISRLTYLGPNISQAEFVEAYIAKYGTEPVFSASHSYDSLMLMVKALQENPDNPAEYLKNKDLESVTYGEFSFDDINGVATDSKQFKLFVYEDGDVREVE